MTRSTPDERPDELPGDEVARFLVERLKTPEQRLVDALDRLTAAVREQTEALVRTLDERGS